MALVGDVSCMVAALAASSFLPRFTQYVTVPTMRTRATAAPITMKRVEPEKKPESRETRRRRERGREGGRVIQ